MVLVSIVPAARKHYTLIHVFIDWAYVRYWATHFRDGSERPPSDIAMVLGGAEDSCGVQLGALRYAGTPNATEISSGVEYLGLDEPDYFYYGKYFWELHDPVSLRFQRFERSMRTRRQFRDHIVVMRDSSSVGHG